MNLHELVDAMGLGSGLGTGLFGFPYTSQYQRAQQLGAYDQLRAMDAFDRLNIAPNWEPKPETFARITEEIDRKCRDSKPFLLAPGEAAASWWRCNPWYITALMATFELWRMV